MTTSQEHWEREQWRVPKVRHTISLDDMLQYIDEKGDELVLYASCSDAQKRLYVKLRGGAFMAAQSTKASYASQTSGRPAPPSILKVRHERDEIHAGAVACRRV